MILRTSGIGVSIVFLREAQWGSRGREFDSRHSDRKSNDFTLEIVGFFRWRYFATAPLEIQKERATVLWSSAWGKICRY